MGMRLRTFYRYGLFALLLGAMLAFLIWPIVLIVSEGFRGPDGGFTLRYFIGDGIGVLRDPLYVQGLVNALLIAVCTTLLCMAITLPLAALNTRYDFPGKALLSSMLLIPLILPPFVGAIGLRALLGRYGALNALLMDIGILDSNQPGIDFLGGAVGGRFWGVVVMEALHLYPILYLNITAAMANLDPALDEAAVGLGAGRMRRFFQVTLPLILPGVFAGATIVFIWSFTELGTPLMFDYYTVTPVQIFWGLSEVQSNPRPYALVVVMLALAVLLYAVSKRMLGGKAYEMQSKASIAAGTVRLRGIAGWLASLAFVSITVVAVLPHIGVVLSSFCVDGAWYRSVLPAQWTTAHYTGALSHNLAMGSIRNSLFLASIAMVLAVIVGMCVSYLNVRVKIKGGWLLDSLAMLPLAVPGLVMAFGYVAMSLKWPFEGGFLDDKMDILGKAPNPIPLLIIAYAVRRMPYVVRSISAGLEQTSGQLEEAALNLGASTLTAIRRIIVPLIMANIIAGAILAFSFAMLEVSDSLILAQKEDHFPITRAIYELFMRLGDGPYIASAMGVWGMALLTITLVGAGLMLGKRMGAIFRV
jgi:iron(III) transport system permease protein